MTTSDKSSSWKQIEQRDRTEFGRELLHVVHTSTAWDVLARRLHALHALASSPGEWRGIGLAQHVPDGTVADLEMADGKIVRAEWGPQDGLLGRQPAVATAWWPITGGQGIPLYTPRRWRTARLEPRDYDHLDRVGIRRVEALLAEVRAAGLTEAAEILGHAYWGWIRTLQAYVNAHPYVGAPEPGSMTPLSALSVVDYTVRHWGGLIPGSPVINDAAVLEEARADEAWHREEDRRMRRDAGEDI